MVDIRVKSVGFGRASKLLSSGNFKTVTNTTHAKMEELWREAAEAFIRASVKRMLVETGMSVASFFPLAAAIRRQGAFQAIISKLGTSQTQVVAGRAAELPSGKRGPLTRSIPSGRRLGEGAFEFGVGSPTRPVFNFSFETVVYQHAFWEPKQRSISAGTDAFQAIIDQNFVKEVYPVLINGIFGR